MLVGLPGGFFLSRSFVFIRCVSCSNAYVGMDKLTPFSPTVLTAAKIIVHSHNLATEYSCLASTGILSLKPGSTNTVPGIVHLSLDIRAGKDQLLMGLEDRMRRDFKKIADGEDVAQLNDGGTRGKGCSVEWQLDAPSAAVRFDEACIRCVEESAAGFFGAQSQAATQSMISGAGMYQASYANAILLGKDITLTKTSGHDSVFTSRRSPTSMIFVPCRDGISHNPAEYCAPEDCANGAQVLMGSLLRFDGLRVERGSKRVNGS